MLQNLTYSYLVAWIVGGLVLLTTLLLRTERRPFALSFGLIGFGAGGFLSLGLGGAIGSQTFVYALLAGFSATGLGFGAQRLSPRRAAIDAAESGPLGPSPLP